MIFVDSESYLNDFNKQTEELDYHEFVKNGSGMKFEQVMLPLHQFFYGKIFF